MAVAGAFVVGVDAVGARVAAVGASVCVSEPCVLLVVGAVVPPEREAVGSAVVGLPLGGVEGANVSPALVGARELGAAVGAAVGAVLGTAVGAALGLVVGVPTMGVHWSAGNTNWIWSNASANVASCSSSRCHSTAIGVSATLMLLSTGCVPQ